MSVKKRIDHNKIRMPVVDIGLVIDQVIIGKFFLKRAKVRSSPRPAFAQKTIGDAFGHFSCSKMEMTTYYLLNFLFCLIKVLI